MATHSQNRRAALITGAAGHLGQKIAEHLAGQGKNIIGLYRNNLPKAHKNMLPLCCDLTSSEALVAPLKSTDTVIHLAWQGGVKGSQALADTRPTDEQIRAMPNVQLTTKLIAAMERANTQKLIFLSWVGVDRHSENLMLREKYWAENAVINSTIPEKIIIRAGVVGTALPGSDFLKAVDALAKIPLILPLPRKLDGVVLTTLKDILWAVDESLKLAPKPGITCRVIDLTSTSPTSGAHIIAALDNKIWGHKRLVVGGIIGDILFKWTERRFGAAKASEPKVTDFLEVSKALNKIPAEGLPATKIGITQGHKTDVVSAI